VEVPVSSQIGVADGGDAVPAQSEFARQPTQLLDVESQTGLSPLQSLFETQATHMPKRVPASAAETQALVPASKLRQAVVLSTLSQPRQVPASWSQIGVLLSLLHFELGQMKGAPPAPPGEPAAAPAPPMPPDPAAPPSIAKHFFVDESHISLLWQSLF
jgi:hypothetical protein